MHRFFAWMLCIVTIVVSALMLTGCGQAAAPAATRAPLATSMPSGATSAPVPATIAPTTLAVPSPVPTSTPVPAASPTSAPPAAGGDLTDAELLAIAQASFNAYPWRMNQSVLTKQNNQTFTSVVEAQGTERVHTVTRQPIGGGAPLVMETILITPTFYGKATGGPPGAIQAFGFVENQWAKIPPTSPAYGLASIAVLAANPIKLLESIGYGTLTGAQKSTYKFIRSENLGTIPTNLYEGKAASSSAAGSVATYQVWIGARDRKIYKMTSDSPNTFSTSLMESAPGLSIDPPIP